MAYICGMAAAENKWPERRYRCRNITISDIELSSEIWVRWTFPKREVQKNGTGLSPFRLFRKARLRCLI